MILHTDLYPVCEPRKFSWTVPAPSVRSEGLRVEVLLKAKAFVVKGPSTAVPFLENTNNRRQGGWTRKGSCAERLRWVNAALDASLAQTTRWGCPMSDSDSPPTGASEGVADESPLWWCRARGKDQQQRRRAKRAKALKAAVKAAIAQAKAAVKAKLAAKAAARVKASAKAKAAVRRSQLRG